MRGRDQRFWQAVHPQVRLERGRTPITCSKSYREVWLHCEGEVESLEDSCRAEEVWDVHSVERVLGYRAHSEGEPREVKEKEILVVKTRLYHTDVGPKHSCTTYHHVPIEVINTQEPILLLFYIGNHSATRITGEK